MVAVPLLLTAVAICSRRLFTNVSLSARRAWRSRNKLSCSSRICRLMSLRTCAMRAHRQSPPSPDLGSARTFAISATNALLPTGRDEPRGACALDAARRTEFEFERCTGVGDRTGAAVAAASAAASAALSGLSTERDGAGEFVDSAREASEDVDTRVAARARASSIVDLTSCSVSPWLANRGVAPAAVAVPGRCRDGLRTTPVRAAVRICALASLGPPA